MQSDWKDEEADVNDAKGFAIVNTDNFGSDYPNESFTSHGAFSDRDAAQRQANELNSEGDDRVPRYYKVVALPYTLRPGFEP